MITLNIFQSAAWLKKTKNLHFTLLCRHKITAKTYSTTINSNLFALYLLSHRLAFSHKSELFIQA